MNARRGGESERGRRSDWFWRLRSGIRYGTTLRLKLIGPVLLIVFSVIGALYCFSYVSLHASIASIYEQRARSVAAVISKSIQEKDYILYYSDELDADIGRLLDRYEAVVGITVVGVSARGFVVVASTDPTTVGLLATEEERVRFEVLQDVAVSRVNIGRMSYLRAHHPIFSGPDLIGVVAVDMSLAEQARYIAALSWRFGVGSFVGFVSLGVLLSMVLLVLVTRPVRRLADAMRSVSRHEYDIEVAHPLTRVPGTQMRDEIGQLTDGFNLMTKVIHSHEQELMKLVVLDELTGTYNVDHLRAELERELRKTRRYKHPTSLLLIDLVGLETRSQADQEDALIGTSTFLVGNLRNVDILFRVNQFRFVALLTETPPSGARVAADRLRAMTPDLTAQFGFAVQLEISDKGWGDEGAPEIEDVLDQITGSLGGLCG